MDKEKKEKAFITAFKHMMDRAKEIGLVNYVAGRPDDEHKAQLNETAIEELFKIMINKPEITAYDQICAAFHHTICYSSIENPKFIGQFNAEMAAMKVPTNEMTKAIDEATKIINSVINGERTQ